MPMRAFKSAELTTFPASRAAALFESSATTTGTPSRHYLKSLHYYEVSLKTSFSRWLLPNKNSTRYYFLILTPPPAEAPRSSLTWMMDVVKRTWGMPESNYIIQRGRLNEPLLVRSLRKAETSAQPVVLLGTTIAFLSFLRLFRARTPFASNCRFRAAVSMDTGGMKSARRETTRQEFVLCQVGEYLSVSEHECINEYGMCEMSSQFYGKGVSARLESPPWVRTLVIDPSTGREAPHGQTGVLRHFDLANVDSVMAIQTEDLGVASPPAPLPSGEGGRRPGEAAYVLLGRASEAELKGCSLSAEAFLA